VTDEMFLTAARTLAAALTEADVKRGAIFPALGRIREVSAAIATAVARVAYDRDLATVPMPRDLGAFVRDQMYDPRYESCV
jgi:malate dehydrogenase (oxaloacetate-decarboxylating)(NADP+)